MNELHFINTHMGSEDVKNMYSLCYITWFNNKNDQTLYCYAFNRHISTYQARMTSESDPKCYFLQQLTSHPVTLLKMTWSYPSPTLSQYSASCSPPWHLSEWWTDVDCLSPHLNSSRKTGCRHLGASEGWINGPENHGRKLWEGMLAVQLCWGHLELFHENLVRLLTYSNWVE